MRVAVTGTPGTGKTTAVESLSEEPNGVEVIHLNEHVEADHLRTGVDETRDSLVADLDALADWLDSQETTENGVDDDSGDNSEVRTKTLVVESHLAHLLDADRVVVLRCRPEELTRRLAERGVDRRKANENAESEALDVILSEAVSRHGIENVYEIDTTDRSTADVRAAIASVVTGERAPSAGTVSFLDFFE
jgi:adenylate kinase